MLEGESDESLSQQLLLFHERALPDLGANVKCGNSLVAPDYYDHLQMSLLGDEEQYRINVFDWTTEFPEVMADDGFSVVIGNPPWLMAGYYVKDSLDYLRSHYESARGKFDLYYVFVEQGRRLLAPGGLFGMIVPNKFFHTEAAASLRSLLSGSGSVHRIVDFGAGKVFPRATNYSCILLLQPEARTVTYTRATPALRLISEYGVPRSSLISDPWVLVDKDTRRLFQKMEKSGERLAALTTRFGAGVQSGADSILLLDEEKASSLALEPELLRPSLRGRDVRRYRVGSEARFLVFPYKIVGGEFRILTEPELQRFPAVYTYLSKHRAALAGRVWFGRSAEELAGKWYGMMYVDGREYFTAPHLLTPSLSDRSNFALGTGALFATGTAGVSSIVLRDDVPEDRAYLLALLNSKLLSFYAIRHSRSSPENSTSSAPPTYETYRFAGSISPTQRTKQTTRVS